MNFNSLDIKHKLAVITHVKLFRIAISRLAGNCMSDEYKQVLIDSIIAEAMDFINFISDEEADEIIKGIESNLCDYHPISNGKTNEN